MAAEQHRDRRTTARTHAEKTVDSEEPRPDAEEEAPSTEPAPANGGVPREQLDQAQLSSVAPLPDGFERLEDGTLRAYDAPPDPARLSPSGVSAVGATGGDAPVCTICGGPATGVAGGLVASEIYYCDADRGHSMEPVRPLA